MSVWDASIVIEYVFKQKNDVVNYVCCICRKIEICALSVCVIQYIHIGFRNLVTADFGNKNVFNNCNDDKAAALPSQWQELCSSNVDIDTLKTHTHVGTMLWSRVDCKCRVWLDPDKDS